MTPESPRRRAGVKISAAREASQTSKEKITMSLQLTPEQRALLDDVSGYDLPVGGLPWIKLLQSNSPELLDSPDNQRFLEGAKAGGFVLPDGEDRIFVPRFHFQIFGWDLVWNEYEPQADGTNRLAAPPHLEKPRDARWVENDEGRKMCVNDAGNSIVETIGCFMSFDNGKIGRFNFSKTSLPIARELANASQRLTIEGENIKGCVLGRYLMTSRLEKQGPRTWFLPVPTFIAKLGQPSGPPLASVLKAAALRHSFLKGEPWPESAQLTAPTPLTPPTLSESSDRLAPSTHGRITVESGKRTWSTPPPSAPPADFRDGPGPDDEIIPF